MQNNLNGIRSVIFSEQHWGLVAIKGERAGSRIILLTGALKTLNGGAGMPAASPFVMGTELEAGNVRILLNGVNGRHELVDIDSVELSRGLGSHFWVSLYIDNMDILSPVYTQRTY